MPEMKPLLAWALLLAAWLLVPRQALAQQVSKPVRSRAVFVLQASPNPIVAHVNKPIHLQIGLKNTTNHEAHIRLWYAAIPFNTGPMTDLHCLFLRCRNQVTGKEVRYTWWPPQYIPADHLRRELTDEVPASQCVILPIDVRWFCVLPSGKYVLELQYDTRFVPGWLKPDKRAWHGATNEVLVHIHVV